MSKQAAIDRVEVGNAEWIDRAEDVFLDLYWFNAGFYFNEGSHITSDNLWSLVDSRLEVSPREPRAMGALMRRLHRTGYLKPLKKWQPSTRACCHGRPVRVWVVK